ncbi:MAG: hypothetical protein UHX00_14400 [Caryophanon sp.]|nr:hypothetical protein [Caryophanon sp.]
MQEVDALKRKQSLTAAEQQKIQGLTQIIELLTQTLNIEFITKNLKVSSQYEQSIKTIQKYLN